MRLRINAGNTFYLYYELCECLLRGIPVIFQYNSPDSALLFLSNGVLHIITFHQSTSPVSSPQALVGLGYPRDILVLVDSIYHGEGHADNLEAPHLALLCSSVRPA